MSLNPYFNNYNNPAEQQLFEDMQVESIEMFGMRVYYLPRTVVTKDNILREGEIIHYEKAIPITAYLKGDSGWGGDGVFLSKYGPEIRASITFVAAMRSFKVEAEQYRPNEGDLIYLPLNGKLFTIQFVDHETHFYELGKNYTWDIPTELFDYSNEKFATGISEIDDKYNAYSNDTSQHRVKDTEGVDLESESGDFFLDEDFELNDVASQNDVFEREAHKTLDHTETDPFGVDRY